MDRRSVIAMSLGTLGVLAAGTIAGVAVYNVASSSSMGSRQAAASAPASTMQVLEPIAASELPSLPEVQAPASPQPTSSGIVEPVSPSVETLVPRGSASAIVLAEAPGVALKVTGGPRKGYQAWAVQVQRPDGSVVTGYVDRATGVIFDWTMDHKAPVIAADDEGSHDDEYEHEDDGGEHEEREDGEDDDD